MAQPRRSRGWAGRKQSSCSFPPAPGPCPRTRGLCWDAARPPRANAAPAAASACISGDGSLPPRAMVSHAARRESRMFSSLCNTPENHFKCPDRPRPRSFSARGFPCAALPPARGRARPRGATLGGTLAGEGLFQQSQRVTGHFKCKPFQLVRKGLKSNWLPHGVGASLGMKPHSEGVRLQQSQDAPRPLGRAPAGAVQRPRALRGAQQEGGRSLGEALGRGCLEIVLASQGCGFAGQPGGARSRLRAGSRAQLCAAPPAWKSGCGAGWLLPMARNQGKPPKTPGEVLPRGRAGAKARWWFGLQLDTPCHSESTSRGAHPFSGRPWVRRLPQGHAAGSCARSFPLTRSSA